MAKSWLYRILRPLATPAFKVYFRTEIEGKEHVPKRGPVILASVHRSYLDTPFVGLLTMRQIHFMAKAELWERRFSRWFCQTIGSFPVKRGGADRSALDQALRYLDAGEALALFPEGSRQEGPLVQPLHHGVAFLAQRTGAPVVPVAVAGSERAMGLGASFPRPAKVKVRAGPALDLCVPGARPRAREKASDLLRSEIQRLFDELRGG